MTANQYLVTTPKNPNYNGKTLGVLFQNGRAFVSVHTIDTSLGRSVEQIVQEMADRFGYEVEQVGGAKLDLFDGETVEIATTKTASKKRQGANA